MSKRKLMNTFSGCYVNEPRLGLLNYQGSELIKKYNKLVKDGLICVVTNNNSNFNDNRIWFALTQKGYDYVDEFHLYF